MINQEIREKLSICYPNAIIFDNPAFDNSIIGVTDDGNVIYNYEKMIIELAEDDKIGILSASEFIDYNTFRALRYMPDPKPIIMFSDFLED